ncbi:MAG TPA: ATP-binding cassette domain-containing protein, partial [Candidatus Ornithospirochaeta stercorigallinarum]|nr:ATP-binding cassette domain-containing protein [Candidatus Ornithospirochaeta stercorigallinarum]
MVENVISITDLRKFYLVGDFVVRALDGVDLTIKRGAFTAIMGPSGSGKSTLMNMIGCLDSPTSGLVSIDGEITNAMDEAELA